MKFKIIALCALAVGMFAQSGDAKARLARVCSVPMETGCMTVVQTACGESGGREVWCTTSSTYSTYDCHRDGCGPTIGVE